MPHPYQGGGGRPGPKNGPCRGFAVVHGRGVWSPQGLEGYHRSGPARRHHKLVEILLMVDVGWGMPSQGARVIRRRGHGQLDPIHPNGRLAIKHPLAFHPRTEDVHFGHIRAQSHCVLR